MDKQPPDTIRKLHALVQHPNTPEHEREQARKALDRLMKKWNLTEEDLTSEVRVRFVIWANSKAYEDLIRHVIYEVLRRIKPLNYSAFKGEKRGSTKFVCDWTLVEVADFQACYYWYADMLANDLSAARRHLKEAKAEALKKINNAKLVLKEIPSAFVGKYRIGYDVLLAGLQESGWSAQELEEPKEPKLTAKQREAKEAAENAYWDARSSLADGSRWEKPVGNVGGGTKELSNGEDDFRLES